MAATRPVALVTGASSGIGKQTARAFAAAGFEVIGTAIDVLVNNAGVGANGAAEEFSVARTQEVFDVNVHGIMRMTKAVLPHMRTQRRGRVINVSSLSGLVPSPFMAIYTSTKHAIEGYSGSLDRSTRRGGAPSTR